MSNEKEPAAAPREGFQIRFDGPPGPVPGRFVECETLGGKGLRVGRWEQDGSDWLLVVEGRGAEPESAAKRIEALACGWMVETAKVLVDVVEKLSAEERRVLDERIAELLARGVKFEDSSELDEAAEYLSRRDAIESGEATWAPGAVLRSRCYECGHLLAGEASHCPQCGTEFDDREWPATVLWSCVCRRCTEAKGGEVLISVTNEGER